MSDSHQYWILQKWLLRSGRIVGPRGRWAAGLAAYGVLNAVLYASLMPLWEGFDEPFHYGYVERLATHGDFPVTGRTPLTGEIWESLHLAPGSYLVKRNLPFVTSFSEYFTLPLNERRTRRQRLFSLGPELRLGDVPGTSNYEAQQPPLAYLVMALPNRLWADVPLPARILRLRMFCAITAVLLMIGLTLWLATLLGLPNRAQYRATFVVLSSQMFYGSVAHVANEWLVIPLIALILIAAIRFHRDPRFWNGVLFGATLASALLTKAYALSWALYGVCALLYRAYRDKNARVSAAVALGIIVIIAGPWYLRNLRLYGNLSGSILLTEPGGGNPLRAIPSLPWLKLLIEAAHGALWTGNNSFTSFSVWTLNLVLVLMLGSAALWLGTIRDSFTRTDEWLTAAGCLSYMPALIYYCGMMAAFNGESGGSVAPWYLQVLSLPVVCLLFLGCARSGLWGHFTGAALVVLSTYMLCATYLVKLIPLYSGHSPEAARLIDIWRWYTVDPNKNELLTNTSLASTGMIWSLTAVVTVAALTLCFTLVVPTGRKRP